MYNGQSLHAKGHVIRRTLRSLSVMNISYEMSSGHVINAKGLLNNMS